MLIPFSQNTLYGSLWVYLHDLRLSSPEFGGEEKLEYLKPAELAHYNFRRRKSSIGILRRTMSGTCR